MKKTKILAMTLASAMLFSMATGCSQNGADSKGNTSTVSTSGGGEIVVNFWSAPEQYNYDIWSKYAGKFNQAGIQLDGKKIKVEVQQMPAQPSSEAGIQNAIATGTVPAISENINRSFGATLAKSEAAYDLSKEDWFKAIVAERKMDSVMSGWAVNGAQYVLPLYVNPISYVYNSKALKQLGVTKVPETLDDFNKLLNAYNGKKSELNGQGISNFMYRFELTRSDSWWERWFDFEAQYEAFSQGKAVVDGDQLVMDKASAKKVFDLYGSMGSSLLTGEIPKIWQEKTVPVVVGMGLPWDIATNKAAGKVYGLDGDYVFGPMLIEKSGDKPYTFADSKGLVLYKNKNISEDQHKGAIEFLKYVFTGAGKDTFDVDWLDTTSMLPVRGDLQTNSTLTAYFTKNPELKAVSAFVADGIPCMAHEKMSDILTALAAKGLTPYVTQKVANSKIGSAPDSSSYVDAAFDAMKTAGNLK
jgi:multiple sugar transport system substrate-binding protein